MTQEDAQSEESLIRMIEEVGDRDAEGLSKTPHS